MANKIDKDIYNAMNYKDTFDKSSKDELSFFDKLQDRIKQQINGTRHITINNLTSIKESMSSIRNRAQALTESIINHDEHMIVEKQKIVSSTLHKIHKNQFEVFNFESNHLDDRVYSIEHLHSQLLDSNIDYFNSYKHFLSGTIENININYDYLKQKSQAINYTIEKHFNDISDTFQDLDQNISLLDKEIKKLITIKSHKEDILDEFFKVEINNLIENQFNFSINEDAYSEEIKDLTKTKNNQYDQFKLFLNKQSQRLEDMFKSDVEEAYNLFYHEKYGKSNDERKSEHYAKKKIKPIIKEKKKILYEFKNNQLQSMTRLKKGLDLYQNFYKTDPFLAQIFFDEGSKVITDEVDYTRLYKTNKSLKYHIYFKHKLAQLNHQIKLVEYQFVHYIENKFLSQEIDLINIVKDIKTYLIDAQSSIDATQIALKRDKQYIIFLNDLMDKSINHNIQKENITRAFLSEFTSLLDYDIHLKSDNDIQLLNKTSDIKLALKESEIDTIHAKHMYENEKRMLLIQQQRLVSENEINYDLITSTLSNEMRFAKEQIKLADKEFKLRLSNLVHTIDSERIHYYEMITHEVKLKEEESFKNFSKYQKHVYEFIEEIESTDDSKLKHLLEKKLKETKIEYRKEVNDILYRYRHNKKIQLYQKRLDELDMYLEDAYLSASKIHDKTVEEMDEIYRYAEAKLEEVVEAIDQDAFPMDDFLYESLQESKKRLNEKLLYAQIALDEKISDKIDAYKKLYFKLNEKFDSKKIISLFDQYQKQLEDLESDYQTSIHDTNQEYALMTENYNHQIRELKYKYQEKIDQINQNKNKLIKDKTLMINQKDKAFNDYIKLKNVQHKNQLEKIIENYYLQTKSNQSLNQEFDNDFNELIKQYDHYINYSKKSKNIRKLIKKTLRKHRSERKGLKKALKKEIKHKQLL